jgi:hypothetical protein
MKFRIDMILWDRSRETHLRQHRDHMKSQSFQPIRAETCDLNPTKFRHVCRLSFVIVKKLFLIAISFRRIRNQSAKSLAKLEISAADMRRIFENFIWNPILLITCLIFSSIAFSQRFSHCHTNIQSASETTSFAIDGYESTHFRTVRPR